MKCCSNCDYGIAVEGEGDDFLECHRHAITAVGLDEDGEVVCAFPCCEPTMWCGDWARTTKLSGPSNYAMEW